MPDTFLVVNGWFIWLIPICLSFVFFINSVQSRWLLTDSKYNFWVFAINISAFAFPTSLGSEHLKKIFFWLIDKSNPFISLSFIVFSIVVLFLFNFNSNLHKNLTNINKDSQSKIRILQHQSGVGCFVDKGRS